MRSLIVAFALLAAAPVLAQAPAAPGGTAPPPPAAPASPPPAYGAPIDLSQPKRAVAAAEAEALRNGWGMAIAVVDPGGHLVFLSRLDGTQNASVRIAEGKAVTAVNFRRPTKALEDSLQVTTRILAIPGIMPLEGGLPIVMDGKIVGGIGVSGALQSQDAQVARAGLDALK